MTTTSSTEQKKIELTHSSYTVWLRTEFPKAIQHAYGNVGNAIARGDLPTPPHCPGPKPKVNDHAINEVTGKLANPLRLKYTCNTFTEEQLKAAKESGTFLDQWDLGLCPASQALYDKDVTKWSEAHKTYKTKLDKHNENDKGVTCKIIDMLGPQTLARIRTHSEYESLTADPPNDETVSVSANTLLKILNDQFASGNTADKSSAFEEMFDFKIDPFYSIHETMLIIDNKCAAALDAITDAGGNIKASAIKSLVLTRLWSTKSASSPYVQRAMHRILLAPPQPGNHLPTPAEINRIILDEYNMSMTIDSTTTPESEVAAAFAAQTTAQTTAQTALTTSKKSDKPDCKWCLEKFGIHRQGHLAGACSNNPANAGKPRPPPRHPKGGRPAAGHIANAGAAAATATPPQSPSPAGSPADNNSSNTYWQLEQAKTQGKFDALLALMTTSSSSDYHGSTAGSVITQGA